MKRCALIISDDLRFREWLGHNVSLRWPKMMLEYCRLANAPMYLDRAELERYQLIVVRLGFSTFAEITTCIFLMRILNLPSHPEIILIADDPAEVVRAKTTKLAKAHCLQTSEVKAGTFEAVLEDIAARETQADGSPCDGAPSIPGYVIECPLAATYSTTVYRAFSKRLGKDVALKVCASKPLGYGDYHQLTLRQEYDVLRSLSDEYVAAAYEYGEVDELGYMALEYIPRGSLSRFIRENGRRVSRVDYMLRVAKGLREIHNAGFLHLDLKPNNVLIREDGSPVLIDFGISKRILLARYQDRQVFSMGSPYFMSPEQARGEPLDVRSDIYSFGALWFRIFTGRTPFSGRTFEELRMARANLAPSMGDVLWHYQPIVDKTLAADRDARFSTAQELIDNIEFYSMNATGMHRQLDLQELERQGRRHGAKARA
jgi:hypothetical protein